VHNYPEKLRDKLQETLDGLRRQGFACMGFCGTACGTETRDFELVFRADDCITFLLGSPEERKRYERTYFLSKGWLRGSGIFTRNTSIPCKNMGKEHGKAFWMMLGHYKYLEFSIPASVILSAGCAGGAIATSWSLTLRTIPAADGF
jgi:hypothetical protein